MTLGFTSFGGAAAGCRLLWVLLAGAAGALGGDLFDEVEETNSFLGARYGAHVKDFPGLTVTDRSEDGRDVRATPAEVPARIRELLAGSPGRTVIVYHFIDDALFDVTIGLAEGGAGVEEAIQGLAVQLFGPKRRFANALNDLYDDLGEFGSDVHLRGLRFVVVVRENYLHVRNRNLAQPAVIRAKLERMEELRRRYP